MRSGAPAAALLIVHIPTSHILLHFGQLLPLSLHGRLILRRLLRVLALRLRLQLNNLPSQDFNISSVATDAGLDLIEPVLKSMESSKSNVVATCASALELVVDGGVLVGRRTCPCSRGRTARRYPASPG